MDLETLLAVLAGVVEEKPEEHQQCGRDKPVEVGRLLMLFFNGDLLRLRLFHRHLFGDAGLGDVGLGDEFLDFDVARFVDEGDLFVRVGFDLGGFDLFVTFA